jgi:hypothetical protein
VEWANRASTALPNGHCGLPRQQSCDHSNKCLPCPVFITTSRDLAVNEEQRQRTVGLIAKFDDDGHTWLADKTAASWLSSTSGSLRSNGTGTPARRQEWAMSPEPVTPLAAAARRRHEQALERTSMVLPQFEDDGRPLTYAAVAAAAQVSRARLYTQPDLRAAIDGLGAVNGSSTARPVPTRQRTSKASLLRRLEAAHAATSS